LREFVHGGTWTVEGCYKCRGLKKEGGNLLRGIPPTKKALTPYFSVRALMARFVVPDVIGRVLIND
jgi:hypothetical protein